MLPYSRFAVIVALTASLSLTACASTQTTSAADRAEINATNDPFEGVNRVIFDFNDFLDRLLIAPLAGLYRVTVPPPVRDRVANILNNMSEPVTMANNMLQGEFGKAGTTFGRLVTNTTLGVGGTFEVANDFGMKQQHGDFGQTLHVWGAGSGPYIVLPLFGPSNVRDAIGLGVDTFMSPWKYIVGTSGDATIEDTYMIADTAASALTRREGVLDAYESLKKGSLDFYAQMRSVYRQHRAKELGQTLPSSMPKFDDYDSENNSPIVQ